MHTDILHKFTSLLLEVTGDISNLLLLTHHRFRNIKVDDHCLALPFQWGACITSLEKDIFKAVLINIIPFNWVGRIVFSATQVAEPMTVFIFCEGNVLRNYYCIACVAPLRFFCQDVFSVLTDCETNLYNICIDSSTTEFSLILELLSLFFCQRFGLCFCLFFRLEIESSIKITLKDLLIRDIKRQWVFRNYLTRAWTIIGTFANFAFLSSLRWSIPCFCSGFRYRQCLGCHSPIGSSTRHSLLTGSTG